MKNSMAFHGCGQQSSSYNSSGELTLVVKQWFCTMNSGKIKIKMSLRVLTRAELRIVDHEKKDVLDDLGHNSPLLLHVID